MSGTWDGWLRRELAPTPARYRTSLRVVLATLAVLLVVTVFRLPYASLGLYFVLLVNRSGPALTLRSSLFIFASIVAAVAIELGVVAVTMNGPIARLVSCAVVTFIGGVFMHESSVPTLGSTTGFIFVRLMDGWEIEARANDVVEVSLWSIAVLSLPLLASLAVELVLVPKTAPAVRLDAERTLRLEALEKLFGAFGAGADVEEPARVVEKLAAEGQVGMQRIYAEAARTAAPLAPAVLVAISMLGRLLDVAAAFGARPSASTGSEQERARSIAARCGQLRRGQLPLASSRAAASAGLEAVDDALDALVRMPVDAPGPTAIVVPSAPLLPRGAFSNPAALAFGAKVSLCATGCYVLYQSVKWPSISSCVITVMITALIDTGGSKQRLGFRLLGNVVGGLLGGIAVVALLFPQIDSITELVVIIAVVAFGSAWIANGRVLGYFGGQLAFAFYTVAITGSRPPVDLTPARDNFLGILLAVVVMWVVFDQLWPVTTLTVMRRSLAKILRRGADLLRLLDGVETIPQTRARMKTITFEIGSAITALRTMTDRVSYDRGPGHAVDTDAADEIVRTSFALAALSWSELALFDRVGATANDQSSRMALAAGLEELAVSLETGATAPDTSLGDDFRRIRLGVIRTLAKS